MRPIVPPITFAETGPQVANLIEALLLLVERGLIKSFDRDRPTADELRELAGRARKDLR